MDAGDYEMRRKTQNREAQRRYRQKQKQRAAKGQQYPEASGSASQASPASSSRHSSKSHSRQPSQYPDQYSDMAMSSAQGFGDPFSSGSDEALNQFFQSDLTPGFEDYAISDAGNYFGGDLDLMYPYESTPSPGRKEETPKAYTKIKSKVGRIMDDLEQVYKFGVEMDLMRPDQEIDGMMTNMKGRFERSINMAAQSHRP